MTKITTILWDMDGTLIDSEHVHTEGAIYASKVMGFKYLEQNIDRGLDGVTVFQMMSGMQLSPQNKDLYKQWFNIAMDYVIENFYKSGQIPQTMELVHEFSKLGLEQSIVSNSTSKVIHECANKLGISKFMSNFVGRDSVNHGKPSPEPYLRAIELHNTHPKNCLAFEDSQAGIEAATTAGIKVIGVGEHIYKLPVKIDYICSFNDESWLEPIKARYL